MKIIKVLWFIQRIIFSDGSIKDFKEAGFNSGEEVRRFLMSNGGII